METHSSTHEGDPLFRFYFGASTTVVLTVALWCFISASGGLSASKCPFLMSPTCRRGLKQQQVWLYELIKKMLNRVIRSLNRHSVAYFGIFLWSVGDAHAAGMMDKSNVFTKVIPQQLMDVYFEPWLIEPWVLPEWLDWFLATFFWLTFTRSCVSMTSK